MYIITFHLKRRHLYSPTTMKAVGADCKFRRVGLTHTDNCPNNVNALSISTNKMFICIHWYLLELPKPRQWPHVTVHLLTHVHCKPTHFVFYPFKADMSYSLQTNFVSVMKDWADKYPIHGTQFV